MYSTLDSNSERIDLPCLTTNNLITALSSSYNFVFLDYRIFHSVPEMYTVLAKILHITG